MRNVWTIARREYHRFFTSPIAYVVAFVMLLTLGIMFSLTMLYYRQNALGGGFGAPTGAGHERHHGHLHLPADPDASRPSRCGSSRTKTAWARWSCCSLRPCATGN